MASHAVTGGDFRPVDQGAQQRLPDALTLGVVKIRKAVFRFETVKTARLTARGQFGNQDITGFDDRTVFVAIFFVHDVEGIAAANVALEVDVETEGLDQLGKRRLT